MCSPAIFAPLIGSSKAALRFAASPFRRNGIVANCIVTHAYKKLSPRRGFSTSFTNIIEFDQSKFGGSTSLEFVVTTRAFKHLREIRSDDLSTKSSGR